MNIRTLNAAPREALPSPGTPGEGRVRARFHCRAARTRRRALTPTLSRSTGRAGKTARVLLSWCVAAAATGLAGAAPASQPADEGPFEFKQTPLMQAAPRAVF